jgi:hypothetical protein
VYWKYRHQPAMARFNARIFAATASSVRSGAVAARR